MKALTPLCPTCDAPKGIAVARVRPAVDGHHDVEDVLLECGHVAEHDLRLEAGVVDLLQRHRPDTVQVLDAEPMEADD
ncbi:hypothetical protein [Halomarina oriensis]|uniref:Uncharacterized protein n=1 Tax=Halomarina oriensis TaxID=671145 RepID=A0A6B0GU71_9EURY|nr:hypothetical protein [Halomarina oriensis]MWG36937.1 hypothetical protein [Halomarina oriensis]